MKHILIICMALMFVSCNKVLMNKGHGAKVKSTSYNYLTSLEFKSRDVKLEELKKRSELNMWDRDQLIEEAKLVPQGGELTLRWSRAAIGSADAQWFTAIVKQNGVEVLRQRGESSVPFSTDIGWSDLMIVYLPKLKAMPFDVYLVDDIQEKRFSWQVTP